jgi:hypothetical protein
MDDYFGLKNAQCCGNCLPLFKRYRKRVEIMDQILQNQVRLFLSFISQGLENRYHADLFY